MVRQKKKKDICSSEPDVNISEARTKQLLPQGVKNSRNNIVSAHMSILSEITKSDILTRISLLHYVNFVHVSVLLTSLSESCRFKRKTNG